MSVVDRFICRREGHKPAATLTGTSGVVVVSYITKCMRCGKFMELQPEKPPPPLDSGKRSGAA